MVGWYVEWSSMLLVTGQTATNNLVSSRLPNSNSLHKRPWRQSSHHQNNGSSSLSKYRLFSPGLALLINLCRLRSRRPENLQRQRAHRLPRMRMPAVPMMKSQKRVARVKPATPKSLVLPQVRVPQSQTPTGMLCLSLIHI